METITRERLLELYTNRELHPKTIAKIFKCDRTTVYKAMQKFEIPLRLKYKPSQAELQSLYTDQDLRYKDVCQKLGISSSKLFTFLRKYEIRKNKERLKVPIQLTEFQKECMIGWMLGDGYMRKSRYGTAQFCFGQSRDKTGYVRWVHKIMQPFSLDLRFVSEKCWHKDKPVVAYKTKFETHYNLGLVEIYDMFYPNKTKIVPDNIGNLLTPLNLAIWYMDDGQMKVGNLSTHGFMKDQVEYLGRVCSEKFGLEFKLIPQPNNQYMLRLGSVEKFFEIVAPYVWKIPCMRYKLPKRFDKPYPKSSETNMFIPDEGKIESINCCETIENKLAGSCC